MSVYKLSNIERSQKSVLVGEGGGGRISHFRRQFPEQMLVFRKHFACVFAHPQDVFVQANWSFDQSQEF